MDLLTPSPVLFPYTVELLSPLLSPAPAPTSLGGMKQNQGQIGQLESYFGKSSSCFFEMTENAPSDLWKEEGYK